MGSKWIMDWLSGRRWCGFIWLRIGTGGGLFWTRWWTFRFWHHRVSSLVRHRLVPILNSFMPLYRSPVLFSVYFKLIHLVLNLLLELQQGAAKDTATISAF
jgi:hypothetical protein